MEISELIAEHGDELERLFLCLALGGGTDSEIGEFRFHPTQERVTLNLKFCYGPHGLHSDWTTSKSQQSRRTGGS